MKHITTTDISGPKVTINRNVLLNVSRIALFLSRCKLEEYVCMIQQAPDGTISKVDAEGLLNTARNFADANEALYALQQSKTRPELEITTD